MAGGIQGNVADATGPLLKFHGVEPMIKWVDDFIFFRSPMVSGLGASSPPSFTFDLSTIKQIKAHASVNIYRFKHIFICGKCPHIVFQPILADIISLSHK